MPKHREARLARGQRPRGEHDTAMARGSPRETVEDVIARRGGISRSDLARDDVRGASSPIGHGMGSKDEPKKKRR